LALRLHVDLLLQAGLDLTLPPAAARHVQVLRLQPGGAVTLFNGSGGEWSARITHMGRSEVRVVVEQFDGVERELGRPVTLAVGMPANERFDWLIEKATELGAAAVQPLICERSVLRLSGERADKKRAHWQAIASAAAEQCGRNRVPVIHPVLEVSAWLGAAPVGAGVSAHVLSLADGAAAVGHVLKRLAAEPLLVLSGPEGGLSAGEERRAVDAGLAPLSLGPRTLRAETAPLVLLAGVATHLSP
jgi:16S rRNA (uracil1498-N3)-methyltransferase